MGPTYRLLAAYLVCSAPIAAAAAEPAAPPLAAPATIAPTPPASAVPAPPAEAPRTASGEASESSGSDALEPAEGAGDDLPVQFSGSQERFSEAAPIVVVSGPQQPPPPTGVRAERRLALLGELGWNTLAGFGPSVVYHATPHISVDFGAGLSLTGWKVGLRGRYNLLKNPLTPFAGVGFMGTSGLGSSPLEFTNEAGDEMAIKVKPSSFVQAVLGLDYTSPRGFTFVTAAGWAWLLNENNVTVISGTPTEEEEQAFDFLFGSSIVLSVAIGYSFK